MANEPQNLNDGNPSGDDSAWGDCPAGELTGLVDRLNTRDQRRRQADAVKTFGAVAAGVALLVVSVGLIRGGELEPMACKECLAHFDDYHQHLTDQASMDDVLVARMERHLSNCGICKQHFEEDHPGMLQHIGQSGSVCLPLARIP